MGVGLWDCGFRGPMDGVGLISSSGLLLLGFVIIRRERASERASESFFLQRYWVAIGLCFDVPFLFALLNSPL
jgi:hypothetical protein